MSRNQAISLALLIAVLAAAYLWWPNGDENRRSSPSSDLSSSVSATAGRPSPAVSGGGVKIPLRRPKGEVLRDILGNLNHEPIEFYGRVVDQSGVPVAEAQVNGQVIYNSGTASGVKKTKTETDANGRFSFHGLNGRTLDFNIVKQGYQFMPEGEAFSYTKLEPEEKRHHPDSKNPVVLKMWKLSGAEPLIYGETSFELPSDGSPVQINLESGKIVPDGGHLIITVTHAMKPEGAPIGKYDWRATIAAVDGGLMNVPDRITNMLLAPEDGYIPAISVEMPATRPDWIRTYTQNFYLNSRNGRYARLSFDLNTIPTGRGTILRLKSWLNPSGSRNLEYDPRQIIEGWTDR